MSSTTVTLKTALVLIPTFSQTIEQRISRGLMRVFEQQPVRLLFVSLGYLPKPEDERPNLLWIHQQLRPLQPDLVLIYGGGLAYQSPDATLQAVLDIYHDLPVINLGNRMPGVPCIVPDNFHGMLQMMRHLVSRQPDAAYVFISGPESNQDNAQRLQAARQALTEHALDAERMTLLTGDFSAHTGYQQMAGYLKQRSTTAPEHLVVVCANDLTAKGALQAVTEANLTCPERVWVCGFDDFEYAETMSPSLTTVQFPAEQMGAKAAQLGLQWLNEPESTLPAETVIQSVPIFRQSTGDTPTAEHLLPGKLLEQRRLIQLRDSNAQKLSLLRALKRSQSVEQLIREADHDLAELSISHLSLFLYRLQADGSYGYSLIDRHGRTDLAPGAMLPLPAEFGAESAHFWLMCPLEIGDDQYGMMLARSARSVADFAEFIAPQFAELIHAELLQERNDQYRQQNELNERMASLGTLVSGVAHEINTPIGTGKLAASSLLEEVAGMRRKVEAGRMTRSDFDHFLEQCGDFSKIIYQSLDRAAELISNFKLVSVDQTAEQKRQFDLGQYIDSVLVSLRHQLKGTAVTLQTELAPNIVVDTYPGAVAQVVTNLFMNALKHGFHSSTEPGTISLRLQRKGTGFELQVSDNGRGASAEILQHIFDPFFTTRRGDGGSGLGMHIVYNLVQQKLHWEIRLESEPGQGFSAFLSPSESLTRRAFSQR